MIETTNCPVCNSTESKVHLESKNFRINMKPFTVKECTSCTMRYTSPLPAENEIGEYYASENYISHTGTKKGLINTLFHMVRFITIRSKFRLISKVGNGKKLLDVGAGNGVFLNFVNKKGWDVNGVELDDTSRAHIEETLGKKIATTVNDNEEKGKLKKDGTLLVAVPNCASHDEKRYQDFWSAYDLPIHLYHFRPQNVKDLFAQFDMEVVDIKPMKFDAYWISLESEKYKNGVKNSLGVYIKGFWYGLISNLKAKNGEYSSQIYVIRNK